MIGRPQNDEAAPYYFTYIDQVIGDDAVVAMENQWEASLAFFSSFSEDRSLSRYGPGKWSLRQVLSHINDTERVFAFRAFWFSRGLDAPLPSFDQNVAASAAQADKIPWAAHVDEFRLIRLSTMSLFRNMPPEAWTRSGIASGNSVTVRALAYLVAGHLSHHVAIMRERYQ